MSIAAAKRLRHVCENLEVPGGSLNNLKLVEPTTQFAEVGVVQPLEDVFWKLWECLVWNGDVLAFVFFCSGDYKRGCQLPLGVLEASDIFTRLL